MADLNEEFRYAGAETIEFVRVDETGLEDFASLILPNVLASLNGLETPDDARVFVIGVTLNGAPAGALVGAFREFNEIFLHSIVVEKAHRRMGLGAALLRCALRLGLNTFPEGYGAEETETSLFVHADYSLPEADFRDFEAFLRAVGFSDFSADSSVCILPTKALAALPVEAVPVFCLAEAAAEDREAFSVLFADQGLETAPEQVFFLGDEQAPRCMILASDAGDGDFFVSSVMLTEDGELSEAPTVSESEYLSLAHALATAAGKTAPSGELYVDCTRNAFPTLWEHLAREYGLLCPRQEAGLYVVIE